MGTENAQAEQGLWVPLPGLLCPGCCYPAAEPAALPLVSVPGHPPQVPWGHVGCGGAVSAQAVRDLCNHPAPPSPGVPVTLQRAQGTESPSCNHVAAMCCLQVLGDHIHTMPSLCFRGAGGSDIRGFLVTHLENFPLPFPASNHPDPLPTPLDLATAPALPGGRNPVGAEPKGCRAAGQCEGPSHQGSLHQLGWAVGGQV